MKRLLIIGGSDAGISAGLRARVLDPSFEVTLVLADRYPNFSVCGLPFYISGETPDWRSLAHRTFEELSTAGLKFVMDTRAEAIDPDAQQVAVRDASGLRRNLEYDRLIVATGAEPIRPSISGTNLDGVYVLHTMDDSFAVRKAATSGAKSAVIVGGGYLGLEMADAFSHLDLKTTVVEMASQLMTTVDADLARRIEDELRSHHVRVELNTTIDGIERGRGSLSAHGPNGFSETADLVLVVVGVRPNVELAAAAGINLGSRGAIRINRRMETNLTHIYAAGDCAETHHRLMSEPAYLPLGTTAHKQGRIAGENAAGGSVEFAGSLGTQVVKVFDVAVARTGLRDLDGRAAGFEPLTVGITAPDHKAYYPGARELLIRITGDRRSGRLLGAQIAGDHRGQLAKRIDIVATAIFNKMSVAGLVELDLSYTPPFSSPWDPVQLAAEAWLREQIPD